MKKLSLFLLLPLLASVLYAQETTPPSPDPQPPQVALQDSSLRSLSALLESLQAKQKEIGHIQEELKTIPDEITREKKLLHLKVLQEESEELKSQFETIAVEVDTSLYEDTTDKAFNLQSELENLVKPIVTELKSATAEARLIDQFRSDLAYHEKRRAVAMNALSHIQPLIRQAPSDFLKGELEELAATWERRRADADHQATAIKHQLDSKLAARQSLLDTTTGFVQNFVQSRGMNLLWGIAAFCVVFFGMRFLNAGYRKLRPQGKNRSFFSRLLGLVFQFMTVAASIMAVLAAWNIVGDWFLLGIALLFLLGVGWASINTLPRFMEQIKMMLNFGSVRETERLVFNEVPWRVDSLGFAAILVNPLLTGGVQIVPTRYLVGMVSRVTGDQEEWFPCREGDWVELSDGRRGKVVYQSPENVQLVLLGGSQVMYPTPAFLALNPKTLATNFRVEQTFGIDYQHQAICTTEVPGIMKQHLTENLRLLVDPEQIVNISVQFKEAGASSLDYAIMVDLKGDAAPKYNEISRAIARILVDVCNEKEWTIPFQQITIHKA